MKFAPDKHSSLFCLPVWDKQNTLKHSQHGQSYKALNVSSWRLSIVRKHHLNLQHTCPNAQGQTLIYEWKIIYKIGPDIFYVPGPML